VYNYIVAMPESVNLACWTNQFKGQGSNHHLSPNMGNGGTHQLLRNVTVHHQFCSRRLLDDSQLMLDRFGFSLGTASDAELLHCRGPFSRILFRQSCQTGCFRRLTPTPPAAPGYYLVQSRTLGRGDFYTGEEVDKPSVSVPMTLAPAALCTMRDSNVSTWSPILMKNVCPVFPNTVA
jgi:hypothetical protein